VRLKILPFFFGSKGYRSYLRRPNLKTTGMAVDNVERRNLSFDSAQDVKGPKTLKIIK